ncbi:hypothetical protein IGI04_032540 [Brassica rapa subsp. trilocularis]|uniref:TF-B3 domain-containing protein n=1 Tax=Brassica rapa subsp. trilocularis TaxID=1813537 RepID=A0ABQ7LWR8_BRACM|nr:hypothetical protein IGI04_032540 [Brassica rapa subsp. trilocularis]
MMFPKREIGSSSGLGQSEVDVEKLSFFKIFQGDDLSSESMRAFPYDFIRNVPQNDYSSNMVIRTQWGVSWEVKVSMNPRFYYMEKRGWNQFVNDNALGDKELVTFTHTGLMCFNVNIYEENGKELVRPRTMASLSGIKKEVGESSKKDVKKAEETGGVRVKSKRFEEGKTSKKKKKKKMKKSNNDEDTVPVFNITITTSYLKFLPIPRYFADVHIPNKSKMVVTIHHSNGNCSWEVVCLVRKARAIFSGGWARLVREYPLSVGDFCTFKFIKPTEFHLDVSKKVEEIMSD